MASEGTLLSLETADRGFTITKEISEKDGEHVQIDLEITSAHDAESVVTVEETVPEDIDQSQIGFLPNHEPQEWDVTADGRLALTARLVADGTRQIIYGLRDLDRGDADALGHEPRVAEIGGPAGEEVEAVPAAEAEQPAAEPVSIPGDGVGDADPDADDDTTTAADAGANGENAAETDGGAGASEEAAAAADLSSDASAGGDRDGDGSLAATLDDEQAAELAALLEPHLGDGEDADPVTETKLSQLQDDVADIRSYLPAFEDFLGETGRADDILTELDTVDERLADLEDGPEDVEETIADVEDRLAGIEEAVEGMEERYEDLAVRLESLEAWREDVAAASDPSS
jgi:uncharacterized coiled-coil protein SlyX